MDNSGKPLILCVDDDRIALSVIRRPLEVNGYHVTSAESGYDAFLKIREHRPDLILLDIKMPGMDGFEVCSRLKANKELEGIPVIFVTGLEKEEDRDRAFSVGAVDYLVKPVPKNLLLQKVRSHLESRNSMRPEGHRRGHPI